MNSFFKNWKTTLLGVGSAALNMLANGTKWQQVALSAAMAIFGLVAKDANVTGGTVAQTPEAENRVK